MLYLLKQELRKKDVSFCYPMYMSRPFRFIFDHNTCSISYWARIGQNLIVHEIFTSKEHMSFILLTRPIT